MPHPIISAAFCSYEFKQCYLFVKDEYVVVDYNPGGKKEKLEDGPILISDWLPELNGTTFQQKIQGAFEINRHEAFIFSDNQYCKIDFDPKHLNNAKILEGPEPIVTTFPYLRDTVFANGIDAAINGLDGNVFLFKGGMFAHININSKNRLSYKSIRSAFPSLVGTVFESGIDSAFSAAQAADGYYIFKGNYYANINFKAQTGENDIINGPIKYILDDWTCLREILESDDSGSYTRWY